MGQGELHVWSNAWPIPGMLGTSCRHAAENIFAAMGLSATQAITLFYQQVKWARGLPFEVRVVNWRRKRNQSTDRENERIRRTCGPIRPFS
jgi:addiction module RelB/DinJ family antitoxin